MSAEARAYSPLPSPVEGGFRPPTPIRPNIPIKAPIPPLQPPLPEGVSPFPTHLTKPSRPYLLPPEAPLHDVLDYTDIPRPFERLRAGKTALHESHHVLLASSLGVPVDQVSIRPGPGYLGITVFKGDLRHRPHALQLIAAGGAVATLDGEAEGFGHNTLLGSDLHITDSVSHITGQSAESAVWNASEQLNKIPESVRRIVADIIETKQVVYTPELIQRIIDIAYFEAHANIDTEYIEKAVIDDVFEKKQYEASIIRGDTTTIISPEEGPQYVLIDEKKNPLEENDECPKCHSKGRHTADCIHKEEEQQSLDEQEPEAPSPFPHSADVFIEKKHLWVVK